MPITIEQIRASNAQIGSTLPSGTVAVFAGATSGIGETSLKQFAKNTVKPRIYFLGRSQSSGDRIRDELEALNPEGEYFFLSVDVSLLRAVDDVCREIKMRERTLNLLFLSTGSMITGQGSLIHCFALPSPSSNQSHSSSDVYYLTDIDKSADTAESLHYPVAVAYYARLRLITNLLPLLQNQTPTTSGNANAALHRVVTVFAGTKEYTIYPRDFQARTISVLKVRGHLCGMTTFALEALSRDRAPDVSFIHVYPGAVKTNFGKDVKGVGAAVLRAVWDGVVTLVEPFLFTPVEEAGERMVFLASSAMFPPASGGLRGRRDGVPLPEGVEVAKGSDGKNGSGVYSVTNSGETAPSKVEKVLADMRREGMVEKVWANVEEEFLRITGSVSI